MGFITRVPDHLQWAKTEIQDLVKKTNAEGSDELDLDSGFDRPEVECGNEKELKRSFTTVKLLVNPFPSPQLKKFLDAKVS